MSAKFSAFLKAATLSMGLCLAGGANASLVLGATGLIDTTTNQVVSSFAFGDKTFSGFTCSITIDQTANPNDCSGVQVLTGTDAFGNLGIIFQAAFGAHSVNGDPGSVDILLNYIVTASAPRITDIHMIFNGNYSGTGYVDVVEQVYAGANVVGQIAVQNPPTTLEAAADLSGGPYTSIHVNKDIQLYSGLNGSASISSIGQYFSQVPEPGTIALVGVALLGLAGSVRRRSA
jgi:hypothetical protein